MRNGKKSDDAGGLAKGRKRTCGDEVRNESSEGDLDGATGSEVFGVVVNVELVKRCPGRGNDILDALDEAINSQTSVGGSRRRKVHEYER